MEEIRKSNNTAFGSKAALASVLQAKGLTGYELVEKEDGWVGVYKEEKEVMVPSKKKLVKCRVFRANIDPDNKDLPISVTPNTFSNKKTFWPGQETKLTKTHLNILRDSVEEARIPIPPESGIYASKDPIAVAKNFYPSMSAEVNPVDNTITMVSRSPNYIIEILE